ncbi:sensor histidine kinase [Paenibacillus sp. MER 99-2]|uniref:sensor histidine kinase n=1 Tax=Paenibacillus sp. MER 99-2 TaxID=2939572 RepID=UPI00203AF5AE|nr:sensor histidine kinase [Paenibacillus sp. MER 99-2]MCM3174564.1 sensor histidine kinase [Paenibacillus sp. MER 99-2]
MSQATQKRKIIPYSYKMMITYLLLVLVTDAVIGYVSFMMLTNSRTEIAETNIRTSMAQTSNNLKYQLDEIQRISDTLFSSAPFQRALQKKGKPHEMYLTMIDEIIPKMQSPLQLFGNPIRIVLYTNNNDLNIIEGDDLTTPLKESDYYILSTLEIKDSTWAQQSLEGDDNRWMQVESDRELSQISHVRRMISFDDYQNSGILRITVGFADLLGNYVTYPEEDGISMRLVDGVTGAVMYQRGGTGAEAVDLSSYLTLKQSVPGTDFIIETWVPHEYLQKDAQRLQKIILSVCTISFVVMMLIGFLVARLSGRKMRKIISLVHTFENGSFEKRLRFGGNDEFSQIAEAFNSMATNIQELISNVYAQGIRRKQAELDALQAQINPHFLYNTLSTINSLANLGETAQVTEMVQGLSKFYRLSLNQGNIVIPLEKELEQVETYMNIQRVKYVDAFTFSVDADPRILDVPVIKLILQPIVENVFKHAWYGDTITIRIEGRQRDDRIELSVIDNGVGMKPEQVQSMFNPAGQGCGYGLKNVNDRIKLRYGDKFGLEIGSVYGGGTTVRILLPAEPTSDRDSWLDGLNGGTK